MKQKNIQEYLDQGYIHAAIIFELVGKPKEHIEKTIKAYIENVESQEDLIILDKEIEPAEEMEDHVFSTIADVKLLAKNLEKLTWLCINFTPASIELLGPEKMTLEQQDITHWMNDLLARLHEIGMVQKNLQGQHQILVKNFNAMTRNAIILAMKTTNDIKTIGKSIGMSAEHTQKFIDALVQEGKIKEDKGKYQLNTP